MYCKMYFYTYFGASHFILLCKALPTEMHEGIQQALTVWFKHRACEGLPLHNIPGPHTLLHGHPETRVRKAAASPLRPLEVTCCLKSIKISTKIAVESQECVLTT